MKKQFIFLVVFFLMINCAPNHSTNQNGKNNQQVEYSEERRLNHAIPLTETYIISSNDDLVKIYSLLKDPNIPRSAPIPSVDFTSESIIVVKPKLSDFPYADIEIQSIKNEDSTFFINYKEVENFEFTENKWSNPIVILRVKEQPNKVVLEKVKN
ncbi:hypothetical protein [Moheibacter stercoris]|uniref:Lipoprotein n=1 Tax=Moheibacter stercoris TaxID=1628251 RepID=A0ABV2LT44_9FLAO